MVQGKIYLNFIHFGGGRKNLSYCEHRIPLSIQREEEGSHEEYQGAVNLRQASASLLTLQEINWKCQCIVDAAISLHKVRIKL